MPYMQLARHVPSTDTFRQFSGPVLAGKKAVLRDQLRRSPKNVSSGLSSPSVSNQTGCEPWTVSPSVQSERPRFTAVAALGPSQTLGVEPDPSLDEVSNGFFPNLWTSSECQLFSVQHTNWHERIEPIIRATLPSLRQMTRPCSASL